MASGLRGDKSRPRPPAAAGGAGWRAGGDARGGCGSFHRSAYGAYRLWYTLGPRGPWWVPADGGWRRTDDRAEAHAQLLRRMLMAKVAGEETAATIHRPPLPSLYRFLRGVVLRKLARGHRLVLVGVAKGQFGLFEHLASYPEVSTVLAYLPTQGWREYVRLARSAWSARRPGGLLQVALVPERPKPDTVVAGRLVSAVDDDVIGRAFGHYRAFLARRIGQVGPGLADAAEIVGMARPIAYTAAEISRMSDWLLAEAAGVAGVPRIVMGRNAHAPVKSRLALDSAFGYFHARFPEGLVDRYLFWSPQGAALARQALPSGRHSAIVPFAGIRPAPPAPPPGRERVILYADTFGVWWFPHNFIFQTGDELITGLKELIEAVGRLPETQLRVRAKRKLECDVGDMERLLAPAGRCTISARDTPIEQALAEADLVVTFRATTCEEALHARRPVLFWGVRSATVICPHAPRLRTRTTGPRSMPSNRPPVCAT